MFANYIRCKKIKQKIFLFQKKKSKQIVNLTFPRFQNFDDNSLKKCFRFGRSRYQVKVLTGLVVRYADC
jgi:hypothetical protein